MNRVWGAAGLALALAGTVSAQPIAESFDDVTMLTGWAMINVSQPIGLTNWFQGNLAVFGPRSTDGYIGADYNNAGRGPSGDGAQNNWLLLPLRTLHNGDALSFYTRTYIGGPFADRLQVRLSQNGSSTNVGQPTETGSDVGDFTTLLLDINPGLQPGPTYPNDWTRFDIQLSGLPTAGVSGRLAFRYFVPHGGPGGVNGDYIGIDEVVYMPGGPPAPCYANCDGSTTQPILNVTDFICFQTKYAAGDTYANCDGSTTAPVLNVNDFVCFQTKFVAGCP